MIIYRKPEFLTETREIPDGDPVDAMPKAPVGVDHSEAPGTVGRIGEDPTFARQVPVHKETFVRGVLDPRKQCRFCKHWDFAAGQRFLDGGGQNNFTAFVVREAAFIIDDEDEAQRPLATRSAPWYDPKRMGRCGIDDAVLTPADATCKQFCPSRGSFRVFLGETAGRIIDKVIYGGRR